MPADQPLNYYYFITYIFIDYIKHTNIIKKNTNMKIKIFKEKLQKKYTRQNLVVIVKRNSNGSGNNIDTKGNIGVDFLHPHEIIKKFK